VTLRAIRVANFKAFGTAQRIPLAPITLVFGANSAGKSSLIHALALAHHAVETGELDTQRTQIGGEAIDLGGFGQYVHRRERQRQVEMTFEIDPGQLSGRVAQLLRSARAVTLELGIGSGLESSHSSRPGASARDLDRDGNVRVERFGIEVDGAPLLAMSARAGGLLRLDRLEHQHPAFRELLRGLLLLATTTESVREEDFGKLGGVLDELVPGISARCEGLVPRIEDDADGREREAKEGLLPVSRGRREEDLALAARTYLPGTLRDMVGGLASAVEYETRRLRYLGPLRSYPPRHLAFSQHQDPNWFAGGGHAWDVVRTREDIRLMVNEWLGDSARLKSPYELLVRDLLPASAISNELPLSIAKALHDLTGTILSKLAGEEQPDLVILASELSEQLSALGLGERDGTLPELEALVSSAIDVEGLAELWAAELVDSRSEAIQDLILIDKRTGTPMSHRDVGIGVSQVLPVLVSAYAYREQFVAIEQPEIHLHPALQAELGDVFLGSALGDQRNTFLLETHSEHLILRILRRIRETTDDELPQGVPPTRPDDVAVLYVQPGPKGAEVVHIPVTEDGEFAQPWPEGFFPERAKELF
jgi:hypothetical protein